jgi:hypothetical protein
MMIKKLKNHNFEPILAYGHDPAKVPKFQNWTWWYSIDWKFHTVDYKIIFYFLSCPVTDKKPKNLLPISVATRNFLFNSIANFYVLGIFKPKKTDALVGRVWTFHIMQTSE